ncbi:MAG: precorrin-4 C(11)-methyltransferase [Chloroflexi bacterium]|nr:precorrin-4 C(11)-methyltransferase [Chloroflexota bacterium]
MKVYFVGAGPGDPELLTLKAQRVIAQADIIIHAGSLVNPAVLAWARADAALFDSSSLTLEEVVKIFSQAKAEGKTVARLHSGDPSIFSAVQEQIEHCYKNGIDFEVVPGVSSFSAASAALRQELTRPGVSQTVIISRLGGRTPVPAREALSELARIGATLVLFLSVDRIGEVVAQVKDSYGTATPVAVVERASWPEERVVRGTLEDIAARVKKAGISRSSIIVIGPVLGERGERSLLYDPGFEHSYRARG